MEQTPEQAAVSEQATREAAFERARRKLAQSRELSAADPKEWPWVSLFARRSAVLLFAAVFVVLVAYLGSGPNYATLPPHEQTAFCVTLSLICMVAASAVVRWYRNWRSTPWAVMEDFYTRASNEDLRGSLHELVAESDFDGTSRVAPAVSPRTLQHSMQPGLFWPQVTAAIRAGALQQPTPVKREWPPADPPAATKLLGSYWKRLLERSSWIFARLHLLQCTFTPVLPDFLLARATLVETRRPSAGKFKGALWGTSFGLACIVAMDTGYYWTIFAALVGGLLLLPLLERRVFGKRIRVQKLLVKERGKWRLFSGDWEGMEEADLSWLDQPTPSPSLAGSA